MNKFKAMKVLLFLVQVLILFSCTKTSLEKKMKSLDDNTLLGPDRNKNGVRDDVEFFILERYSDKGTLVVNLLGMYAKNLREEQMHCDNPEKSIELFQEGTKYGMCLSRFLEPENPFNYLMLEEIDYEIMRNTKERDACSEKVSSHANGKTFGANYVINEETCRYNIKLERL